MLNRAASRGLTIIELLVGITIVAIILGIGAPAMGTYLLNSKLGSVTQDFYTGVQLARSEAIRRNVPVEFVLTATPVNTGNVANTLVAAAAGTNWVVRAASDVAGGAFTLVEAKAGREGTMDANATTGAAINASGPTGFAGIIAFNGFGGTGDGGAYSVDLSNPAAGACAAVSGPIRCRRIVVTPGGRISACDPAAPAADSRACPP